MAAPNGGPAEAGVINRTKSTLDGLLPPQIATPGDFREQGYGLLDEGPLLAQFFESLVYGNER